MARNTTNRNIFGSVAVTSILEGMLPSFLKRAPDPEGKAILDSSLSLSAKSTMYASQRRLVIHGLERTGTGYCSELIRRNIKHVSVYENNKHDYFEKGRQTGGLEQYYLGSNLIKYIVCVRHPYSWFVSYKSHHEKRCSGRDPRVTMLTHHCERGNFSQYIKVFNKLYSSWLSECPKFYEYAIIRYEDILQHPKSSMSLLCSRLDLQTMDSFTEVNEYMNNYSHHETLPDGNFSRRDYYLKKEYMHDLSPENKATINKLIDKSLVRTLGYSLDI